MLRRVAVSARAVSQQPAKAALARGLASKAPAPAPQRDPSDPDPNTPWTKVLDRLADVAFMTELFRGVSSESFRRNFSRVPAGPTCL